MTARPVYHRFAQWRSCHVQCRKPNATRTSGWSAISLTDCSFPISTVQVQGVPSRARFAHQWKGLAFLAPRARGEALTRFLAAVGEIRNFRRPFHVVISLLLCLHCCYSNMLPTARGIQLCRHVRHPSDTWCPLSIIRYSSAMLRERYVDVDCVPSVSEVAYRTFFQVTYSVIRRTRHISL